jgi:hypothetical protein
VSVPKTVLTYPMSDDSCKPQVVACASDHLGMSQGSLELVLEFDSFDRAAHRTQGNTIPVY